MRNYKFSIIIFCLGIAACLFSSCSASVHMTYYKDPDFNGKFSKIMVLGIIKDQDYRKAYENEIVKSLQSKGNDAVPGLSVFSADVDYTENEAADIVSKNNIDGILTLKYTKAKNTVVFPKGTFYNYFHDGFEVLKNSNYTEDDTTLNVACTLFAVSNGKAVWISTTRTSGYYNLHNMGSTLGDAITKNLRESKLIK
jgi:hypothetical protein